MTHQARVGCASCKHPIDETRQGEQRRENEHRNCDRQDGEQGAPPIAGEIATDHATELHRALSPFGRKAGVLRRTLASIPGSLPRAWINTFSSSITATRAASYSPLVRG